MFTWVHKKVETKIGHDSNGTKAAVSLCTECVGDLDNGPNHLDWEGFYPIGWRVGFGIGTILAHKTKI